MDLNNHIVTNYDAPFHSNGFAQVASGNHIGSTIGVSIEQRKRVDFNRQPINQNRRSVIGNDFEIARINRLNLTSFASKRQDRSAYNARRFADPSARSHSIFN